MIFANQLMKMVQMLFMKSESDIEAEDLPEDVILKVDVSLEDFFCGKGDEFVPYIKNRIDMAELLSSDKKIDQGRPVPVVPLARPSTSAAHIPLGPPTKPARVRVHPSEPELNIEPNFQVRTLGLGICLLKMHCPLLIFTCFS